MMRNYRGIEYDSLETALLIRTTERPKYLSITLPKTVTSSTEESAILVLNNCRYTNLRAENKEIIDQTIPQDRRFLYKEFSHLLGVPGSINTGVKLIIEEWPETRRIIVCDDDCIPAPQQYVDGQKMRWDEPLSIMLEAGWEIAGYPAKVGAYNNPVEIVIGGIKGLSVGHVGGAFSGFSVESWKRVGGVPGVDKLFGFGPFCSLFKGKVGYWPGEGFQIEHIDYPDNPKSLRTTDYFRWYQHLRPSQAIKFEHEIEDKYK